DDIPNLSFSGANVTSYRLRIDRFQSLPYQVEHKNPGLISLHANSRAGESSQGRSLWRIRSPMKPICIGMLAFGLQRALRLPEAGDIVVDFLLRRNFDEVNSAFAPVSDWLRP